MSSLPPDELGWFIFVVGLVYLWALAVLVWGIWIERYVVKNGEKPASFLLTFFTGWGILRDYRTACKIATRHGHKPWFLRCFEWLAGLAFAGFASFAIYNCIVSFR